MGLHKLTAGDGYTYLTRQVAVHDATDRGHSGLGEYYTEKGESPGRWWGAGLAALDVDVGSEVSEQHMRNLFGEGRHPDAERLENNALDAGKSIKAAKKASQLGRMFSIYTGNAPEFLQETARRFTAYNYAHGNHWKTPVPADVRARIRTELADEMFAREHGRAPLDDRERAGFLAQAARQQTKAVAGYDLTFTPVKSVSALWALADRGVAKQVEDAHHAAVEKTLAYLEKEVLFTRRGRAGVQQVRATGLIAAMFTHRDARSSDPHLHTHVAISNKVQDADGRWLAVDGRVLYKANVTLSEMYNTLLEGELVARLGVRFKARRTGIKTGREKRPVREVQGIDEQLATTWSRRRNAIDTRRRELAAAFQAEHGRPPTAGESVGLAKRAWSETRQAKHAPRSEAEQRATWRAEAVDILGSDDAVSGMVDGALGHRPETKDVTEEWVEETAAAVVETVQEGRATWQVWHLRAETERRARTDGIGVTDLEFAVDRVVAAAIGGHCIAFNDPDPLTDPPPVTGRSARSGVPVPAALTRPDPVNGTASVYSLHGARLYTSRAIVEAEERIVEAAKRRGGRTISAVRVGIAFAETAANGITLNAAQQALVREMATSGRQVQLALAPAGTGKTTAMAVLTRAWQDAGGTILGLAPSAVAAEQLRSSINPDTASCQTSKKVRSDTLTKLVWHIGRGDEPSWMERIDKRTLVLIDEAGMAATTDLAAAIDYVTARGGSVRLIGDDRQLASVAAGGVLRDVAHQAGAVTLTEVRRFLSPDGSLNVAEAAATLAVRDGDPAAIGFYADRGRIRVGDLGSCADQAYAAWAADRAGGTDSVLLAPTREVVSELNTRARNDRIAALTDDQIGPVLTLADGTRVSAGDAIITRKNNRLLAISNTDWVKNGDRWTVSDVHADGSLTVRHDRLGKRLKLPADYVADNVQLGFATTVHGAQGITTSTCHVVLTGEEDRNMLYVAISRGQFSNHMYLAVGSDGDPHNLIRPETLTPPTALDQLANILRRDGSPISATTALREATTPVLLLHNAAARYHDALTTGAIELIGPAGMDRIDKTAETLLEGLVDAPAWPTLRSHLALLAFDDHNPLALLTDAVRAGSLADAKDPAAVIDARIDYHLADTRAVNSPAVNPDTASGPAPGPLPWLSGIPARLAGDIDWGPYLRARHQQVLDHTATVTDLAHRWAGGTAPAWAQPFLEDPDTSLRAQLAVWRAVADTPDTDLRPTGERTIGAPGDHQAMLNRAVRQARPSYPFAQRSWYQALPETVRADPWVTPLCQRLARLERAGLPVGDYITQALNPARSPSTNPTNGAGRPLPDEHQAAALWWRLVPHLGPAALDGDEHSADLLTPTWRSVLTELVGGPRADYLQHSPAWPALVAAVDEACQHHGWTPSDILTTGLAGIPQDGILTGVEVADALVLRIALLTDPPANNGDDQPAADNESGHEDYDPDRLPPEDLDELYRDNPPEWPDQSAPVAHLPSPEEYADLHNDTEPVAEPDDPTPYTNDAPVDQAYAMANDPFSDPTVWSPETEISAEFAFPDPGEIPADRILGLNQQALTYYESCYQRSWAPGYLHKRLGTDLVDHPTFTAGYAPRGPRSLLTHLTGLGATLDELEHAGLIRTRGRRDGTTEYVDVFRDRLIMPIRDPHDPNGRLVIGFLGRRSPTKTDDDYAGPKYLNTKNTLVFTKGDALFGYAETRDALTTGALPVLVEGPMDAYAITLGSGEAAVGLAPMGTALTTNQIKILRRHISLVDARDRIAVATDADPAGWKSAQTAFWNLTAADLDPNHLALPDGLDPANVFETHGPAGIQAAINDRIPLGHAMIEHLLRTAGHWSDPTVRQQIVEQAARILAARGADTWLDSFARLNRHLHLSAGFLEHQTLSASIDRERNLAGYTQARTAELQEQSRASAATIRDTAAPTVIDAVAHTSLSRRRPSEIPVTGPDSSGPRR
jgi:DNA primase catalytic core